MLYACLALMQYEVTVKTSLARGNPGQNVSKFTQKRAERGQA